MTEACFPPSPPFSPALPRLAFCPHRVCSSRDVSSEDLLTRHVLLQLVLPSALPVGIPSSKLSETERLESVTVDMIVCDLEVKAMQMCQVTMQLFHAFFW